MNYEVTIGLLYEPDIPTDFTVMLNPFPCTHLPLTNSIIKLAERTTVTGSGGESEQNFPC